MKLKLFLDILIWFKYLFYDTTYLNLILSKLILLILTFYLNYTLI